MRLMLDKKCDLQVNPVELNKLCKGLLIIDCEEELSSYSHCLVIFFSIYKGVLMTADNLGAMLYQCRKLNSNVDGALQLLKCISVHIQLCTKPFSTIKNAANALHGLQVKKCVMSCFSFHKINTSHNHEICTLMMYKPHVIRKLYINIPVLIF